MNITIILLTYNGEVFLPQCLASLLPLPDNYHLLVVDNGSHDRSVEIARQAAGRIAIVENGENLGFSGGMNRGINIALGLAASREVEVRPADIVVLLNQDTKCLPGWHEAVAAPFEDPSVGAVGCKIYAADGATILHVGGALNEPRCTTSHIGYGLHDDGQFENVIDVPYATGAALAVRGDLMRQIDLFDERFNPAYMEEIDLCERIWATGNRVVVNPAARLIHYESSSTADQGRRSYLFNRGRLLFVIKRRPLSRLLGDFASAEASFLQTPAVHVDLRPLKRAYLDAILRLSDWVKAHEATCQEPVSNRDYGQLLDLLGSLRNQCIQRSAAILR